MLPNFVVQDVANMRCVNTIFGSKENSRYSCCMRFTNVQNVYFHESMMPVAFAASVSPFSNGVTHVTQMSSWEKVQGIGAGWMIAGVQDVQTFRNRPIVQFPREAMSQTICIASCRKHAIALIVKTSFPFPAIIEVGAFDNKVPKSGF